MLSLALSKLAYCKLATNVRPSLTESTGDRLRRLYKDHNVVSYKTTRQIMYNQADCENDKMYLLYGGETYKWKCGGKNMPPVKDVNAEHVVPQSFFGKQQPMVTDLHHLFAAPQPLNELRSNYKFAEVSYDKCQKFCHGQKCTTTRPSNPDDYSCLTGDKLWMPRKADRGVVARAVLYFHTMYNENDINRVGNVKTFLSWNSAYPPSDREITRNNVVNQTQGNRNPYIDNPSLADQVFA